MSADARTQPPNRDVTFPHTRSFPVLRVYSTAIQFISKRNAAWDKNYHTMNKHNLEILWPPIVVQAKKLTRKRIS